jgi:hypothetical protein
LSSLYILRRALTGGVVRCSMCDVRSQKED